MGQRQEQRALVVAGREQAVCATSKGSEWLDDAQQKVLVGAARRPTVAERERIVEAAEGRIEADLARRKESLAATSTGSMLLRAEYGEGGSASSPQQSFAKREAVIARVAQQVDEELEAHEEMLRSMPLGRQYLSAAEQARAGGASGPPTPAEPAERESMVRAAEQRVREELDRREERVLADTGDGRLLTDADKELLESGAIVGAGSLTERAEVIGRAEGLLEEKRAELKLKEADLLEDAAGEELLRKARLDVLGAADREAQTLADSWAVINQAAERKWEGQWTARVEALDNQLGGMDLYHAHLADIDPKWGADRNATTTRGNKDAALSAAESDGARLARLRGVLSDAAAAARYREVLDPDRFTTTDLDRALAAGEREREEREAARRAAALETATATAQAAAARSNVKLPDVRVIYETGETHAAGLAAVERTTQALDDAATQRLPADTVIHTWNANRSDPGGIAAALDAATAARREEERAAAAAARVERQQLEALTTRTGAARLAQRNLNSVRPVEASPVPKPARRLVPDATWEDAEPLWRTLTDLQERSERGRLEQRAHHAATAVPEKTPPAPRRNRLVPDATWEDAEREQEERRQTEAARRRRQKRLSRLEQALSDPAETEAFVAVLDAQKPAWRTGATPADIDQALDAAEGSLGGRKPPSRRYQLVLEMERMIPGAPSTAYRAAAGRFDRTTEVGREGLSISQTLSDRALARAFAAEKPEPPAPRHLVERLFDWLRTQLEKLFRSSGPAAPAGAEDLPRLTFEERYSQQWPEHAADIHRPDFEELAAARNKLFERQELYSSKWSTVDPQELPISLAKPARAWTDEAVQKITWAATPGVGYSERRTLHRQIVDAHLDDYERKLPEQYAYSADWRTILQRAEEAVRQLQDRWRYKWADRRKDDRKKRELEAATINRACGRDARRLHKEMMAARAAARPDWEATVRIRAVQGATRDERIKLEDAARKENLDQRGLTEPTPQLRASHDRAHRGRR